MALRRLLPAAVLAAAVIAPSSASAVVGGQDATQPYPNMAELRKGGQFSCGASLVAPDKVLTAAHCVDDVTNPADLTFVLGRTTRSDGASGEEIATKTLEVHPGWNPSTFQNDVAIATLVRPATKATPIPIVDPATERSFWAPGDEATIIGWGARAGFDVLGVTITDRLQEVRTPIVDDAECAEFAVLTGPIDPETMVCAGNLHGTEDSCQGDSGGPLMVPTADGRLEQAGVVSFGFGCGYPTQYGVYSRIGDTKLNGWIAPRIATATPATTTTRKAKRAKARKARKTRSTRAAKA